MYSYSFNLVVCNIPRLRFKEDREIALVIRDIINVVVSCTTLEYFV